jgi:hypothetical protein
MKKDLKEKRRFNRYNKQVVVRLVFDSLDYEAETIDYSFDGLGLKVFKSPKIEPGDIVDVDRIRTHIKGEYLVRWTNRGEDGTLLGLSRLDTSFGALGDFHLADILIGLQRSVKSGTLHFKHGAIHKRVFFLEGDMIFAASNQIEDRMGEFLMAEGILNREQFDNATEHLLRTKRRLGAVLVELGYIDLKTLYWGVKKQVENVILTLFDFEEGNIYFAEDELPTKEVITLKLSAANLVTRGIKRIMNVSRIKDRCPSSETVLEFSSDPLNLFQDLELDAQDKKVLALVDGHRTFREIVEAAGDDILGSMKSIIALIQTRVLKGAGETDIHHDAHGTDEMSLGELFLEVGGIAAEEDSTLEMLYKIEELHESFNDMTYYEFLGVQRDAPFQEIRKAYYKKAMFLHPDRAYRLPEEARYKLDTLFTFLSTAYTTLMDEDLRRSYDAEISETHPVRES